MRKLDIIVTHYDEPWSVGKKLFDSLAMQRCVNFTDFSVILVQDGKEHALEWMDLLNKYPFSIKVVSITHKGTAGARNAGLSASDAEWVMFCDFDDMFADAASLWSLLDVIPNDSADVIWMNTYREERAFSRYKNHGTVFINCIQEHFDSTDGKMFRRDTLTSLGIKFYSALMYEYQSAFMQVILDLIPPHRIQKLTVDFHPYMKTLRDDGFLTDEHTVNERIFDICTRDKKLVNMYSLMDIPERDKLVRYAAVETFFDMYYIINAQPKFTVSESMHTACKEFFTEHGDTFKSTPRTELEVIFEACTNKIMSLVQHLYNYYGIECVPPDDDLEKAYAWVLEQCTLSPAESQPFERPEDIVPSERATCYTGEKVVVYCGTYNTYDSIITSIKSLLVHTKVDRVIIFAEDSAAHFIPYDLPDCVTVINVRNQNYFSPDGPNYDSAWSYMCMMRAAFPRMLPQYDRILSLDIDVIINEDISCLWDVDIHNAYYAGVTEPGRQKTSDDPCYCNFGVIMMNLDKLRRDGKDADIIHLLNTSKLGCPEQDAFNKLCAGHIITLAPDFNVTPYSHITGEPEREIITHYAGIKYWKHFRHVKQYSDMSFADIMSGKEH